MLTGKKFSNKNQNHSDQHRKNRETRKATITGHDIRFILGRTGWIFPLGLAIFLIAIPFFTAGLPGNSIYNIEVTHDQLKFRLINEDVHMAVIAASIVMGMITGSAMFRFLQDKKETTIFLSMGITRKRLFIDRMTVAFVMLAVMIAIPMAISVVLNFDALGGYQGLVRNAVFLWAGLFLMAAVSCTAAAFLCFVSGNLMELTVYWVCIMSIPTVLCMGLNMLLKKLCWGNAWGVTAYSGTEQIRESLLDRFAFLNPVLFFKKDLKQHAQFMRPLSTAVPERVSWIVIMAWFAVLVVLTAAAWLMLRRWKAENAGITGNGKLFAEITAAVTGFLLFAIVFSYLFDYSSVLAACAGVVIFIVIHLLWKKAGILGQIRLRTQCICILTQLAALLAICLIFASGFFGSAERFLQNTAADHVKVSCTGDPSLLYTKAGGSSTGHGYYVLGQIDLKSPQAVEAAKELHRDFIASGRPAMESAELPDDTVVPYDMIFTYTQQDGTERTWYYDRASFRQLEAALKLEETEEVRTGRDDLFASEAADQNDAKVMDSMAYQAYRNGSIYVTGPYLTGTCELTLGADKRIELMNAIRSDIGSMTLEERYFTQQPPKAVLMFSQTGEDDSNYFAYHLDNAFVYLTAQYQNTLKWLEANQLLDYVEQDPKIESITLQRMDPYIGINRPDYPMGMYFMSYCADSSDDFMIQKDFGNEYVITDPEEIEAIAAGLKNGYYMSRGGYLAAVKLAGIDGYRYLFLPETMVPEFIRG